MATVNEEKKVSYHIITGELRDKIGTLLMKQPWVDVYEVMKVLTNLASVEVEQNQKDQKELQFNKEEITSDVVEETTSEKVAV